MKLDDYDFGYFGKGLTGYVQYNMAVDRIEAEHRAEVARLAEDPTVLYDDDDDVDAELDAYLDGDDDDNVDAELDAELDGDGDVALDDDDDVALDDDDALDLAEPLPVSEQTPHTAAQQPAKQPATPQSTQPAAEQQPAQPAERKPTQPASSSQSMWDFLLPYIIFILGAVILSTIFKCM